jgi:hypothetical protein
MNSKENQTINTACFKENIKEFTTATNILTDLTFQITTEISLEAKSVVILELNKAYQTDVTNTSTKSVKQ